MTPQLSLALCMLSIGAPMSAPRMPVNDVEIGPIVVPQAMLFFTMNSCRGDIAF